MPRRVFAFDTPDPSVAGAVGEPGARAFYLQARQGGALVSAGLEKTQGAALGGGLAGPPAPGRGRSARAVHEATVELCRVGAMALDWDATAAQIVIEAQPLGVEGEFAEVPDT